MKPKPLDLEEDEIQKRVKEILKNREDYKYLYDIFENFLQKSKSNLNNGFVLFPNQEEQISIDILALFELSVKETIKEITQRLKSACEFYLRYKDKPELLKKEQKIEFKLKSEIWAKKRVFNFVRNGKKYIDYNEWLFKLAFKPMFEGVKNGQN